MTRVNERRALQAAVAVCGLVPVAAGLAGVWLGPALAGGGGGPVSLDSHFRYLSGLLLGIGLAFWSTIPEIERSPLFRWLAAIVFIGGLSRLYGLVTLGWPDAPMRFGLAMELGVTPALAIWRERLARAEGLTSRLAARGRV